MWNTVGRGGVGASRTRQTKLVRAQVRQADQPRPRQRGAELRRAWLGGDGLRQFHNRTPSISFVASVNANFYLRKRYKVCIGRSNIETQNFWLELENIENVW